MLYVWDVSLSVSPSEACVGSPAPPLGLALDPRDPCSAANYEAARAPRTASPGRLNLLTADLRLDHPHAPSLLADYFERCCALGQLARPVEWRATAEALRADAAPPKPSTSP